MSENGLYPGLNLGNTHGDAHFDAETRVFGFWVFLMSDLIIFGILFASYASYLDPIGLAGGPGPQDLFDLKSVAIQTAFLLVAAFFLRAPQPEGDSGGGQDRMLLPERGNLDLFAGVPLHFPGRIARRAIECARGASQPCEI